MNCLAVAPGRVLLQDVLSPRNAARLDSLGVEIVPLAYDKVWLGSGCIHCSTAPLLRDPVS